MMRILFVDDEVKILRAQQRMLMDMADQWEMAFAQSGPEALSLMAEKPFDVVVTDMRMPGMDGADLLNEVMRLYPDTIRIVLSGHSEQNLVMKSVRTAHQYLAKPCDPQQLRDVVGRARDLRAMLADESLVRAVSRMTTLPSLPDHYRDMMLQAESEDGSASVLGEIISQDIGMTAKVLQLVNSAFYGLSYQVGDPARAVSLLGFNTVRTLVLSAHIFSQLSEKGVQMDFVELWDHSIATGTISKRLAAAEGCERQAQEHALAAGILHDTGKLILAVNWPQHAGAIRFVCADDAPSALEAERQAFGTTHPELGAYLFGLWGLPDSVVEAVAFHHRPADCVGTTFTPLTAVHVADALEHARRGVPGTGAPPAPDAEYLARLGKAERLPVWKSQCLL
jgi:HD-like signal output (HDOD) protein